MDPVALASVATAVVLVGGALFGIWVKHGRPRLNTAQQFLNRIDQTINGRPAEYDAYGVEKSAAIPPLVEQQAATQKQLGELTAAVQTLVAHTDQIAGIQAEVRNAADGIKNVEARVTDLERRVTDVEHLHQVERITGNVAQAKVVDAIAEANRRRGVIDAESEEKP